MQPELLRKKREGGARPWSFKGDEARTAPPRQTHQKEACPRPGKVCRANPARERHSRRKYLYSEPGERSPSTDPESQTTVAQHPRKGTKGTLGQDAYTECAAAEGRDPLTDQGNAGDPSPE